MTLYDIVIHELPLVLFTTFSQCSIGFLWIWTYFYFKNKGEKDQLSKFGLKIGILMVISIIPAFFHLGDITNAFKIIYRLGFFIESNGSYHIGWMNNEIAFVGLVCLFGFALCKWQKNFLLILANLSGVLGIFFMAGAYGSMSKSVVMWDFNITLVMFYSAAIFLGAIMYHLLGFKDENSQKVAFLLGLLGVGVHFSSIFFQTLHVGQTWVMGVENPYDMLDGFYFKFIVWCSSLLGFSVLLWGINKFFIKSKIALPYLTLVCAGVGVIIARVLFYGLINTTIMQL
ncbi:dimethyl sulfoxide reductase anchor subunit family protein [Campylobacter geochelonis]|uniref:dimethyl sulfoxide reductase anchor subunit family protein n=1 Tax=Campylobacter geochelonis TaxID=1780362 RepID=UPI000770B690|nr:DmsC/YnfH family molybdoenzyme membrane anchor subunit [Campylobacter geochelonis]CZE45942.1 Anaerobic dimethyl sulfoxide reductase chain C [Campylobacter geochelonis]